MNLIDRILPTLTTTSAIGSGLTAGVLFAFSTSVMPGLSRQSAPQAIAAMQSMNSAILNPAFLGVFMGTSAACFASAVLTPFADTPGAVLRVAGSTVFLVGVIGLTAAVNVPMNDHLATLDPNAAGSAEYWTHYLSRWTTFNNARIVSAAAGAVALTLSALRT